MLNRNKIWEKHTESIITTYNSSGLYKKNDVDHLFELYLIP